jgi:magnesium and cobalt transporter
MTNKSFFEKLLFSIFKKPTNKDDLVQILHQANKNALLDSTAFTMIEGVLQISEMQARDIMIPRAQMAVIEKKQSLQEIINIINDTTHSRFPVIDDDRDDVEGVVLAKDFLPYAFDQSAKFDLRSILRPTTFIPESKRLNTLLNEFQDNKSHMAIVVDEFGGVAGLVTIEDVLEQIVGEIEDEYDIDDDNLIKPLKNNTYIIKAITPIDNFNEFFDTPLSKQDCDTVGGLVMKHFGHLPKRDESIQIENYLFKVLKADSRHLHKLEVTINR